MGPQEMMISSMAGQIVAISQESEEQSPLSIYWGWEIPVEETTRAIYKGELPSHLDSSGLRVAKRADVMKWMSER